MTHTLRFNSLRLLIALLLGLLLVLGAHATAMSSDASAKGENEAWPVRISSSSTGKKP
jgi:hypothetical protein